VNGGPTDQSDGKREEAYMDAGYLPGLRRVNTH